MKSLCTGPGVYLTYSAISEGLKRNKGFAGRWRALGLYSDILDHVIALQPVGGVGSTGANRTLPGSIVAA